MRTPENKSSLLRPDENGRLAYRLKEAAAMLGVTVSTLRSMVRAGELNPITGFRVWLISAEDIQKRMGRRLRDGN